MHRVLLCALAAVVLLSGASPCRAADPPERPVLSVSGVGEVAATPDVAFVRIGVEAENESAGAAQSEVSEIARRILAALEELSIEDRDVQTSELQIRPVYETNDRLPRGTPRIRGYAASNVVRVRVRELSSLGKVVDAALAAGGNRVDGVSFGLLDDSGERTQALEKAVADARAKARAMSGAIGIELGSLRSLREVGGTVAPVPEMALRTMAADGGGTPTMPGEIVIRAQVMLEYALE